MRIWSSVLVVVVFAIALLARGCGGSDGGDSSDEGGAPPLLTPGGDGGFAADCVNLCRRQVVCADSTTAITGHVKDPAGKLPVYNAIVYVPNAPVPPFAAGASCDRCGTVPGSPLVATLTDASGYFELNQVPEGKDVPLVVQIGRWRRQVVVPEVTRCARNPLADIRLPRNKCEGDIPQIALATGGDDAMECWLRKIGLDDSEFTTDAGPGRVHLYAGSGTQVTTAFDATKGALPFTAAQSLWSDPAKLGRYDAVLLSCEGQLYPATKPPEALSALKAYTDAGGRVLASHWHRYWFSTHERDEADGGVVEPAGAQPSPFALFATWNDRPDPPADVHGDVDSTSPKGAAMRLWLGDPGVGALDAAGRLPMPTARHNVDAVDAVRATPWVTFANTTAGGQKGVALLSSNMPADAPAAAQCGRVTYADLHASPRNTPAQPWPSECGSNQMSEEEKALEFLLFDLTSCIGNDRSPPAPPPSSTGPCFRCSVADTEPVGIQTPVTSSCPGNGG